MTVWIIGAAIVFFGMAAAIVATWVESERRRR